MSQLPRRQLIRLCTALAIACSAMSVATPASAISQLAIVGATVINPERDAAHAVAKNQTVVMTEERITAIGPAEKIPVPKGATVIDGHGKWVVPGLIDSHVHFFQSGDLYTRPDVAAFPSVPYAQEVARNKKRLPETFKVWLASGVTGVVDIGGPMWNFDVRILAEQAKAAPRMAVAGPLLSMVARPQLDLGDPPIIKVADPKAAHALVVKELEKRPDYIKVWFINQPGDDLNAQTAIVREAAKTANFSGVPLAVHATELKVAKAALRAGATYLVHSVEDEPIDNEFITLAKKNNIIYCPTLFVHLGYEYALSNKWKPTEAESRLADPQVLAALNGIDKMPEADWPPSVKKRMAANVEPKPSQIMYANLRKVRDAGITIAMGTDAGNIGTVHGPSIFREMAMMQEAGMTPLEVLRSATVGGSRALRLDADAGTLTPGKYADVLILNADPLANLQNLSHAYRVIKDGRVYDPEQLMQSVRK
jgi:imidazolonepropionase-like amidohydrolase